MCHFEQAKNTNTNMKNHYPLNRFPLACAVMAGICGTALSKTIYVDLQPGGADDNATSTPADFQAFDANASDSAPVTIFESYAQMNGANAEDEDGGLYLIETQGSASGFSSRNTAWPDMVPILEGYAFTRESEVRTVTISGIEAIPEDELITLTVFGIGDNINQQSTVTPSYGGITLASKTADFGVAPRDERGDAVPEVQWQFVSDGSSEISFTWEKKDASFAALNGFMISSFAPSFGTASDITVVPDSAVVLDQSNPFSLSVTADFSSLGDDVDVSALSTTTYSATPTGVVEISPSGLVTALMPGSATITVTVQGDSGPAVSDMVEVTVEEIQSLSVSIADPILIPNGRNTTASYTATGTTLVDVPIDDFTQLVVESSDTTVLQLGDDVTEIDPGEFFGVTTLTAQLGNVTATADVTIEPIISLTATATPETIFVNGGGARILVTGSTTSLTDIPLNDIPGFGDNLFLVIDRMFLENDGEFDVVTPEEVIGVTTVEVDLENQEDPATGVREIVSTSVTVTIEDTPDQSIALRHRYSFNEAADSTSLDVIDSISGFNGTILGEGATYNGTELTLPGGPNGADATAAYVDLPNGMASALPGAASFETWVSRESTENWERIFSFGSSDVGEGNSSRGQTYFTLIAQNGDNGGPGGVRVSYSLASFEGEIDPDLNAPDFLGSDKTHYVVTWDTQLGLGKLYVDGVEVDEQQISTSEAALADLDDVNNWIGRTQYGNPRINASFDEFRIYTGIMTPEEVTASFTAGPDSISGITLAPVDPPVVEERIAVESVSYQVDAGNPSFTLNIATVPNTNYQVQFSDTLNNDWANVDGGAFTATAESFEFEDTSITTSNTFRFYRVIVAP